MTNKEAKKYGAISILTTMIGVPAFLAFLGWLATTAITAEVKNAEQDKLIQFNKKGVEASIKTNALLCTAFLDDDDIKKREKFCVKVE